MYLLYFFYRPELLNRLDDIITFHPLQQSHLQVIVLQNIQSISNRLQSRGISLTATPEACQVIVNEAYDPLYGARPLKRYLEKRVVTEIGKLVIGGQVVEGDLVVVDITSNGDIGLRIEKGKGKPFVGLGTNAGRNHDLENQYGKREWRHHENEDMEE